MANKSRVVQVKKCRCGKQLEIRRGQAGMLIHCPVCQEEMIVDSLSTWNSSNCIEKCVSTTRSMQFSLAALLMLFVPFALMAWIAGLIGSELTLLIAAPLSAYFLFVFGITSLVHYLPTIRNWIWDTGEDPETD